MLGNRGGRMHDPETKTLRRAWATRAWICCELSYKGWYHEPMGEGYTSLFFLDEVTALAAGHRPCFMCRREDAKAFLACLDRPMRAADFDRLAHADRLDGRVKRCFTAEAASLPDATMVLYEGAAYALQHEHALAWSAGGYLGARDRASLGSVTVLTPRLFVGILARGYRPRWHESAQRGSS